MQVFKNQNYIILRNSDQSLYLSDFFVVMCKNLIILEHGEASLESIT